MAAIVGVAFEMTERILRRENRDATELVRRRYRKRWEVTGL